MLVVTSVQAQCDDSHPFIIEVPSQANSIGQAVESAKAIDRKTMVIIKVAYHTYEASHFVNTKMVGGILLDRSCLDLVGIPNSNLNKDKPIIQRSNLQSDNDSIIEIKGSNIRIEGFDIRTKNSQCGYGIKTHINRDEPNFEGFSNIKILNNIIRDIGNKSCSNSFGIAFWNDNAREINDVLIEGNKIYNLQLGSSETITIKNNINGFEIKGNKISDVSNIAIDTIGFEEDTAFQAQNGKITNNIISGLRPGNGAYPWVAGIYIDGGKNIEVINNEVSTFGLGISIASEKFKGQVSDVQVHENKFFQNYIAGVSIGHGLDFGSDYFGDQRGYLKNINVYQNKVWDNGTKEDGGQLRLTSQIPNSFNEINLENNDFCISAGQKNFKRLIFWDNSEWNDQWQEKEKDCFNQLCPRGSDEKKQKQCYLQCFKEYSKYKKEPQVNVPLTVKFSNNRFNSPNFSAVWNFDDYQEFGEPTNLDNNGIILKRYFSGFEKSNMFSAEVCIVND